MSRFYRPGPRTPATEARPCQHCCSRRAAYGPWSSGCASMVVRRQRRPAMAPRPTTIWRCLPVEVHAAMTQLWAELLLRRVMSSCGAGCGEVTRHDCDLAQDRTQAPAAGRGGLRSSVDAAAAAEQSGEHPATVWSG